jgi:hypothetical protein
MGSPVGDTETTQDPLLWGHHRTARVDKNQPPGTSSTTSRLLPTINPAQDLWRGATAVVMAAACHDTRDVTTAQPFLLHRMKNSLEGCGGEGARGRGARREQASWVRSR